MADTATPEVGSPADIRSLLSNCGGERSPTTDPRHDSMSGRCHPENEQANLEKLASGNLVQVVEVVRDLAEREASRGLSAGEKRMLAKARLILLQEG